MLPSDLEGIVYSYLPFEDLVQVTNNETCLVSVYQPTLHTWSWAIEFGNQDVLEYLNRKRKRCRVQRLLRRCVRYGRLDLVQWFLRYRRLDHIDHFLYWLASQNYIQILHLVYYQCGPQCDHAGRKNLWEKWEGVGRPVAVTYHWYLLALREACWAKNINLAKWLILNTDVLHDKNFSYWLYRSSILNDKWVTHIRYFIEYDKA